MDPEAVAGLSHKARSRAGQGKSGAVHARYRCLMLCAAAGGRLPGPVQLRRVRWHRRQRGGCAGTAARRSDSSGSLKTAMPIIGLLAGRGLASTLGHAAHWIGAGLLVATGVYALIQAVRSRGDRDHVFRAQPGGQQAWRLIITGVAPSIDNLAVGFALGTYHVSLWAAIAIGAVSVGCP